MVDFGEPHEWGNGFDSSVCEDCPHREKNALGLSVCGLCGCPTGSGMPMSVTGAPPESCPRLDEHAAASGD